MLNSFNTINSLCKVPNNRKNVYDNIPTNYNYVSKSGLHTIKLYKKLLYVTYYFSSNGSTLDNTVEVYDANGLTQTSPIMSFSVYSGATNVFPFGIDISNDIVYISYFNYSTDFTNGISRNPSRVNTYTLTGTKLTDRLIQDNTSYMGDIAIQGSRIYVCFPGKSPVRISSYFLNGTLATDTFVTGAQISYITLYNNKLYLQGYNNNSFTIVTVSADGSTNNGNTTITLQNNKPYNSLVAKGNIYVPLNSSYDIYSSSSPYTFNTTINVSPINFGDVRKTQINATETNAYISGYGKLTLLKL